MKWQKKGLIYCPNGEISWQHNSFMTPVPVILDNETIRVFGGVRDESGVSRIGFVDISSDDPSNITFVSKDPVIDIGEDGCFDDNGIILGSLLNDGEKWRMYYVGFQKVGKVKFYAFSGIAESNDLLNFKRKSQTPVMERKDWMRYIGAIHTVIKDGNNYKVFYAAGNDWKVIGENTYPVYSSYYTESEDGYNFNYKINREIVRPDETEYRIGRPTVYKDDDGFYKMFCSYDKKTKNYGIAYFESQDCLNWHRKDNKIIGLNRSDSGWDSEMVCYPSIIKTDNKTYLFYNGNGMGRTGFGYAELINS